MNRTLKNLLEYSLAILLMFFISSTCFSKTILSEEILSVNFPDKIIFDHNFSSNNYLFSLDIKNLQSKAIENISILLDSNDFVDNSLLIKPGSLGPNENKSIKPTSIFNDFIEDWKGSKKLNLSVTMNYYYLDSYHNISFKIPIIYDDSRNSEKSPSNSNDILVVVESNKNIDDLFSKRKTTKNINSLTEIRLSRSWIDKKIIFDEILRKKILNVKIEKPDSISLYGRVLSINGTPLGGVTISHKFINEKSTSNAEGYYALSLFKGDLDLVYECDGYWSQEIKLNIQENKSYNLKTTYLIPRLSTATLLAFDSDGRPWHLPNKKAKIHGNLLDVVVGFTNTDNLPSINTGTPYFIYIPAANSVHSGFELKLYRIYSPNVLHVKNPIGSTNIRVGNLYVSSEDVDIVYDSINNGKAYKIKPFFSLDGGKFAFSNILGKKNPLTISIMDKPLIYPFKTMSYNAPKFFVKNKNPLGVVSDYEILDKWIDSETVLANISISNTSGGWYLVDILHEPFVGKEFSDQMRPVITNNSLKLPFLMEPANDKNKFRKVSIHNIKFRKNNFLRVHAYRDDAIIAYVVALDIIYRVQFGRRLTINDLEIFETLVDKGILLSEHITDISKNIFNSVKEKNYKNISLFILKFKKALYSDSVEAAIKSGLTEKLFGKVAQDNMKKIFSFTSKLSLLIKLPGRIILLQELVYGELSAKMKTADSIIYTK